MLEYYIIFYSVHSSFALPGSTISNANLKHVKNDLNEDLIEYLTATNATVVIFITAIHTVFVQCMYFFWSSTLRGLSRVVLCPRNSDLLYQWIKVQLGQVQSKKIN